MIELPALAAAVAASALAGLRWLRVSQREHYLPGSSLRFAVRWWALPLNVVPGLVAIGGVMASVIAEGDRQWIGVSVTALAVAIGPIGLGLRGRTSSLAWTARSRRMGVLSAIFVLGLMTAGWSLAPWLVALAVMAVPAGVDLAAAVLAPVEERLGERWVTSAVRVLDSVGPRVVAITGSYGKTTTKIAVAHLVSGVATTVASPASFNNRMGLARAINEGLSPGTEVFVAEMGTYGPGEIADLCAWIPPDVAVITAIGPVHLERMGSEEAIVAAKREILAGDACGVLNVDHPLLAALADEESGRRKIVRCSGRAVADADVVASAEGTVTVQGVEIGRFDPTTIHPSNVACAVGAVVALGIDPHSIADRLASVPVVAHRQVVSASERGFAIVDDTFNANPAGAARALAVLADQSGQGRRVVVTPGMVELGRRQDEENRRFASEAAHVASHLVVVGRTNRRSLVDGAGSGRVTVIVTDTREEAVEWVRDTLGPGDAVLYENDLPDHYP